MGVVTGRVGGSYKGYEITQQTAPDSVTGRIGGKLQGGNVELKVSPTEITGRVGGRFAGGNVNLTRSGNTVTGKTGNAYQIEMKQENDTFSGWIGHPRIPRQIKLTWADGKLSGRIGDALLGQDITLDAGDTDPMLAAVLGCAAFMFICQTPPPGLKLGFLGAGTGCPFLFICADRYRTVTHFTSLSVTSLRNR